MHHGSRWRLTATVLACALTALAAAAAADCVDYSTFPVVTASLTQGANALEFLGDDHLVGVAGTALAVFGLADAATPALIATVAVPGSYDLQDLAICGTTAYCVDMGGVVQAVDLADATHPSVLGPVDLGGSIDGAGGAGNLLGVVENQTWRLYEVTDPLAPQPLHQQDCGIPLGDVEMTASRAVVQGIGWYAYDLTDPSAPVLLGGESFPYVYENDYAFGTTVLQCVMRDHELVQYLDEWQRIGDWVYGSPYFQHVLNLRVVDISTPGSPVQTASIPLGTSNAWPVFLYTNLALDGDLVYAQGRELGIYDLEDGLASVAAISTGDLNLGLAVRDNRVYAANQTRLTAFAIPEPVVDNRWPVDLPTYGGGQNERAVAGDGWFAVSSWAADEHSSSEQVHLYDLAISATTPVAQLGGEWYGFDDLDAAGDVLYVVEGSSLYWVDMTDPAHPGGLQSVPIGNGVSRVAVGPAGLVAVSQSSTTVKIFDLDDPATPVLRGSVSVAGDSALDMLWRGDLVLVANGHGLHVVDAQDPAAPVVRATLPVGMTTWVRDAGDTQVLAGTDQVLRLIDVANPSAPVVLTTTDDLSGIRDITVVDGVVHVASGGVSALRLPALDQIGGLAPARQIMALLTMADGFWGVPADGPGAAPLPTHCDLTAVESAGDPPPATAARVTACPNPFNPRTEIRVTAPAAGHVVLSVFDLRGREVRRLVDGTLSAGVHRVAWEGDDDCGRALPSGAYLLRLATGGVASTAKVMLLE